MLRLLTVFALVWGVVVGAPTTAVSMSESFADLVEKNSPSVVNISTTTKPKVRKNGNGRNSRRGKNGQDSFEGTPFENFFDDFMMENPRSSVPRHSLGSGVVISKDGYILTNNHVVANADDIVVKFNDEDLDEFKAKVVGRDPKNDIALLKVEYDKNLPAAPLGNSDKVRVGDWVLAIGNPFGLGGTVTAGIISARGRNINQGPYDDFLQTDAAINPGNSGGPLFNTDGEIIGINTAILSRSGGSQGIGFSIPINTVKLIVEQIKEYGRPIRGWLGVRIQTVTPELAEVLKLEENEGALVAGVVEGSPAEKAGIKDGDVILSYDGHKVRTMRDLPKMVAETKVNKSVKVKVLREGANKVLSVDIAELEEEEAVDEDIPGEKDHTDYGMILKTLTAGLKDRLGLDSNVKGVLVESVDYASEAARVGIRGGDVIVQVNQKDVSSVKEVRKVMATVEGKSALLLLLRDDGKLFVALKFEEDDE